MDVLYILASWCNGTGDTQHMGLMIPRKLFDSTRCYHKFYIIEIQNSFKCEREIGSCSLYTRGILRYRTDTV